MTKSRMKRRWVGLGREDMKLNCRDGERKIGLDSAKMTISMFRNAALQKNELKDEIARDDVKHNSLDDLEVLFMHGSTLLSPFILKHYLIRFQGITTHSATRLTPSMGKLASGGGRDILSEQRRAP